jgi:hypothetical protein
MVAAGLAKLKDEGRIGGFLGGSWFGIGRGRTAQAGADVRQEFRDFFEVMAWQEGRKGIKEECVGLRGSGALNGIGNVE